MRVASFLIIVLFAAPSPVRADDAKALFNDLFGEAIKSAKASSDRDDDLALAKRMVDVANEQATDARLTLLLCENATELAPPTAEGLPIARSAFSRLREINAKNTIAVHEQEVAYLQRAFARVRGDDQKSVGDALVSAINGLVDAQTAAGKDDDVAKYLQRALVVALRVNHPQAEQIKARLNTALQRQKVRRQVAVFEQRLLKDRNDSATAKALVRLYLFELDDPKSASPFLQLTRDKSLVILGGNAAKPMDELTTIAKLQLADFYFDYADDATDTGRILALQRSKRLFNAALASADIGSLDKTKSTIKLRDIEKILADTQMADARPVQTRPTNSRGFAKFDVSGSGYKIVNWSSGTKAFSNRGYVWKEVPDIFKGWSITKLDGGGRSAIKLKITTGGNVLIAIASGEHQGIEKLKQAGWKPMEQGFKYSAGSGTSMTILHQTCNAGDAVSIPRYGWTGTMVLVPAK